MKRTSTGFEKANALYIYANKKNLFYILETEIQFKLVIYLKTGTFLFKLFAI